MIQLEEALGGAEAVSKELASNKDLLLQLTQQASDVTEV